MTKMKPMLKFLGSNKYLIGSKVCYIDFILYEMLLYYDWVSNKNLLKSNK